MKSKYLMIGAAVCAALFLFSGIMLCRQYADEQQSAEAFEQIAEVVEQADYVGSTTGIMTYAEKSDAKEFIIGTENSIVEHLSYACPEKRFYPLAVQLTCMNMKLTTLMDIYHCLQGSGGEEITLPQDVMQGAGRCIRRMVELGG